MCRNESANGRTAWRCRRPVMVPRLPITSQAYAKLALGAIDVKGDTHPKSVSIGSKKVIDESGKWIGGGHRCERRGTLSAPRHAVEQAVLPGSGVVAERRLPPGLVHERARALKCRCQLPEL